MELIKKILDYAKTNRDANMVNEITEYGNGILYFQVKNGYNHFGRTLSKYLKENSSLKVISIASYTDQRGGFAGTTVGYFVIMGVKIS